MQLKFDLILKLCYNKRGNINIKELIVVAAADLKFDKKNQIFIAPKSQLLQLRHIILKFDSCRVVAAIKI